MGKVSDLRVVFLLGQGFEDSEFRIPYDRLRAAGVTVDIVGPKLGDQLSGYKGREKAKVDRGIDQSAPRDYDALVIPGGQSPDHLRADARFVTFVKAFDATGRPLAAVCHGPQLLISAGLVKGRTLTAWKTIQEDLRQIGATVRDEAVVIDRNWITSRQPEDLEAFSQALLRALGAEVQSARGSEEAESPREEESRDDASDDTLVGRPARGGGPARDDAPAISADAATDRDTQRRLDEELSEMDSAQRRRGR
jgi:protease I